VELDVRTAIPIGQAADVYTYFERTMEFRSAGSVNLSARLLNSAHSGSLRAVGRTATIRSYKVRHFVLDGATLFGFQAGRLIEETASLRPEASLTTQRVQSFSDLLQVRGRVIIGCNPNWTAYHHWLLQCLPAIDWSLSTSHGGDVQLALPDLDQRQEEMLGLLGYAAIPRIPIKPGHGYNFEIGDYSDFLAANSPFLVSGAVLHTMRRLSRAVEPFLGWEGSIYVHSQSDYYGTLENSSQVAEFFRQQGFELIDPAQCEIAELVELFRCARVVVGPHSGGMASVIFCKPGTLVWELFPQHCINPFNQRIAQLAGLDYWADVFDSENQADNWTWRVDLAVLAERRQEMNPPRAMPAFWLGERDEGTQTLASTEEGSQLSPFELPLECQDFGEDCKLGRDEKEPAAERILALDELMMEFQSLGDDCEFGLVQRDSGVERFGLLRFAGFCLPLEMRLPALIAAIEADFKGLGELENVQVDLHGEEFMVQESAYKLLYHTFRHDGEIEVDRLRQQQSRILQFLRDKFLADLKTGEKIWIWKSRIAEDPHRIRTLLAAMRRRGPNRLLWLSDEDATHPAGTIDRLETDLVRGFIATPPQGNIFEFVAGPWFEVCRAAYAALRFQSARS
jgi:Glycosyltransferase 61